MNKKKIYKIVFTEKNEKGVSTFLDFKTVPDDITQEQADKLVQQGIAKLWDEKQIS